MIHGCHHNCVNTEGSYRCSCKVGYSLQLDGKTCLAQGSINPCLLLFTYNLSTFKGRETEREITRERGDERDRERGKESQREVEGESALNVCMMQLVFIIVYCYS